MLVEKNLLKRIVSYAELSEADVVLEVGCGTGNLTEFLLKYAGKVIGIEKDRKFVEVLKKRFYEKIKSEKFVLIEGDALRVDFPEFNKFVSNIPYNISSPLTFKLFNYDFDLAVVMYQKEFAERLVREDNRLGIISKAYCMAEILEIVKPKVFHPKPKVESAIVRIFKKSSLEVEDIEMFSKFVTFAFSMRRKKMKNVVAEFERRFGIKLEIDEDDAEKRPEELGARKFAEICLRASRR
ncbi:MAG: 16S rRNA (adenine(1518)-N(6)/adenine(1519)-N(6))-dimethyltransferase RsmA [Archaeoglobaceae archaeon]